MATACFTACGPALPADLQFLSAPAEVQNRVALPACGVELVGRGGPWDLEARDCFWNAYLAGRPAEFITTRPSGGGEPLVAIFRTLGPGRVEVFADETAIRGEPYWTHSTCAAFTPTNDPAVEIDWIPDDRVTPCEHRRIDG